MCDCVSRIPPDLRSAVSYALERHSDWSTYAACSTIEAYLSREAYHRVLKWADSLVNCPECAPRLNGNPMAKDGLVGGRRAQWLQGSGGSGKMPR